MTELSTICDQITKWWQAGERVALATVLHTSGPSYRKPPAFMAITESGKFRGMVGGGCFDADLVSRAKPVIHCRHAQILTFSGEDQQNPWGLATGCGGSVTILLEPLDQGADLTARLGPARSDIGWQSYLRLNHDGSVTRQSRPPEPNYGWYFLSRPARSRLLIFGAGQGTIPLMELACNLEWPVTLLDNKTRRLELTSTPPGVDKKAIDYEALPNDLFRPSDSVILMTHNLESDTLLCHELLRRDIGFIGILGTGARLAKILGSAAKPDHLHSPVGLPLGDRHHPYGIALSIMAQLESLRVDAAT